MNYERKIALQARSIRRLTEENDSLKIEIEDLKQQLEIEKSIPKEGYEQAKELMELTAKTKKEYERLIEECKKIQQEYECARDEMINQHKSLNQKAKDMLKKMKLISI